MKQSRDLDRRVAEALEPMPPVPTGREAERLLNYSLAGETTRSPKGMWVLCFVYEHGDAPEWEPLAFSTSIEAAWRVVERMKTLGWSFRYGNNGCAPTQHAAAFAQAFRGLGANILTGKYIEADDAVVVSKSAPLSICCAALKALEGAL